MWRAMIAVLVLTACVAAFSAAANSAPSEAGASAAAWKKVVSLKGSGSRVITTALPDGPLVFVASHRGSSNFVVELRGPAGEDLLVNEIGSWSGAMVAETENGRHRVVVDADGAWTINVSRPTVAGVKALPAAFAGKGSTVIRVKSARGRELVMRASNAGSSNFVVYLVGYGSVEGRDLLVNEIGPWRGEDLVDVPKGTMLLWVDAEGAWTVRFTP